MFAKVFTQILDSSLAEDYQTRHVFEDLLKLCDLNGVVDMTHEAIARRTNVPIELVKRGIAELEKSDARSRNPDHDGKRIVRLDEHRDWGWMICNYGHYRAIASEEQRREKTLARVKRCREKNKSVTHCNAPVAPANAVNAMQRQKQRQKQKHLATHTHTDRFVIPSLSEVLSEAKKIDLAEWKAQRLVSQNGRLWLVGL